MKVTYLLDETLREVDPPPAPPEGWPLPEMGNVIVWKYNGETVSGKVDLVLLDYSKPQVFIWLRRATTV